MNKAFFEIWLKRKANFKNICFLCGTTLTKKILTKEHVFPKWLQRKFELRNLTLTLPNRTTIPYRKMTVPCCKNCNGIYLSKLENLIKSQVDLGYKSFIKKVSELEIYQWCLLIFYKILVYETFLKANLRDTGGKRMITEKQFKLLELNHLMLRSIDKEIIFENFFPGSVFVCELETYEDFPRFYYSDDTIFQCFTIRMDDIGIVVVLNDAKAQMKMGGEKDYKPYLNQKISPKDLKRLYTVCHYRQFLFNDPYFYHLKDKTETSVKISLHLKEGVLANKIYKPFNHKYFEMIWNNKFSKYF